jgi:hypothetical protein
MFLRTSLALALAASAAPSAQARPSPAKQARFITPERVEYEQRSWGAVTERWTLKGRDVLWEKPQKPGFHGEDVILDVKRFSLSPLQHTLLMSAVRRAQHAIALPDECTNYVPDGPYGSVRWAAGATEKELKFNGSCLGGPNAQKATAGFDVGRIVGDAAAKLPVSETRIAK